VCVCVCVVFARTSCALIGLLLNCSSLTMLGEFLENTGGAERAPPQDLDTRIETAKSAHLEEGVGLGAGGGAAATQLLARGSHVLLLLLREGRCGGWGEGGTGGREEGAAGEIELVDEHASMAGSSTSVHGHVCQWRWRWRWPPAVLVERGSMGL